MKMTRSRKLLSVVLALAICITTVLGCLMTVSAAEPYYTFSNGIVDTQTNTATIDITFAVPEFDGQLRAGLFSVEEVNPAATHLVLQGAASKTTGVEVHANIDTGVISFESDNDNASVTITLTFVITGGTVAKTQKFKLAVTELELASRYDIVTGIAGKNGIISAGCDHVITIDGESVLLNTDEKEGYNVYQNSVCSICGQRFDYQVVPFGEVQQEIADTRRVVYWDGTTTTQPTETDSANNIIINSAAELAWVVKSSNASGASYKVADDIKAFVLQPDSAVVGLSTADTINYFTKNASTAKSWVGAINNNFSGTFDGNGVTIYGMYSSSGEVGFFGTLTDSAVIKNVSFKNCYITSTGVAGVIANYKDSSGSLNLEVSNIVVKNNYIKGNSNSSVIGTFNCSPIMKIENIVITDNQFDDGDSNIPLYRYKGGAGSTVNNVICVNVYPNCPDSDKTTYTNVWANVVDNQTSKSQINLVTDLTTLQGEAAEATAPDFDWVTFAPGAAGEYPDWRVTKEYRTLTDKCKVLYWGGGSEQPTIQDNDGNYIIDTAEKLYWVTSGENQTKDRSFKVADDVKAFVLQTKEYSDTNGVMSATTTTAVETAFANAEGRLEWTHVTYGDGNANYRLNGTFDFNGATIYGMYSGRTTYQGLFAYADSGAEVKNLAVKNSYLTDGTGRAGLIFAEITSPSDASKGVKITNLVATNNYMNMNANSNIGFLAGVNNSSAIVNVENAVICGNDASWTNASYDIPIFRNALAVGSGLKNVIALDVCVYYNTARTYENVYNNSTMYPDAGAPTSTVTMLDSKDLVKGAAAESTCKALDWENTFKATDGYPSLYIFDDPISECADTALTLAGLNLTYNNDGSVNINFYYNPADTGMVPDMYVPDTTAAPNDVKLIKLTPVDGATLPAGVPAGSLAYTIYNISATRIKDLLLPTAICKGDGTVAWGKTENVSIANYAQAVIDGKGAYYANGTSSETIEQDKLVAAAIINYGNSSLDITSKYDGTPPVVKETVYVESLPLAAKKPSTDADGNYIIDTVEKLYWVTSGENQTKDMNFKVPNNIGAFVLQTKEYSDTNGVMSATTTTAVETAFANAEGRLEWTHVTYGDGNANYRLNGTFDFNGATIYGMYSGRTTYQGLFAYADSGADVKNFAVKNSYLTDGTSRASLIFAEITAPSDASKGVKISNLVATNNYMNMNANANVGFLAGVNNSDTIVNVENAVICGNALAWTMSGYDLTLFRNALAVGSGLKNVIVLDVCVYYNNLRNYENVYNNSTMYSDASTPTSTVTMLDSEDLVKGAAAVENCPNFDWATFAPGAEGQYPDFRVDMAQIPVAKNRVEYWNANRTTTQPTTTDSEGNIVINTVAELAWLAQNSSTNNYKVADDVKAFVLQPESLKGILDATTVDETKSFFTTNNASATAWVNANYFGGTLDFNGATVCGMYVTGSAAGSLFAETRSAVVKNVAFENCYVDTSGKVGFITAADSETINISDCLIKNSYVNKTENDQGGILIGTGGATKTIKNVIIYDNEFNYNGSSAIALFRNPGNVTVENLIGVNVIPEYPGLSSYTATYTNVYATNRGSNDSYIPAENVISANVDVVSLAQEKLNLAWDDMWLIIDNEITFMQPALLPDFAQTAYDAMSVNYVNNYGDSTDTFGMYGVSVNLKANPYMTFTFAFSDAAGYDDAAAQVRKDINVQFIIYNNDGTTRNITTTVGNADGSLATGWTHNAGAGRYHLYRLKDIGVNELTGKVEVKVNNNYLGIFSLEGFVNELEAAYGVDPCEYYLTRYNAAKALLFYVKMVNARYSA
ncbi:MAG: hypothetical protein Q4B40_04135 [Clostridia bacterium]|nr:hypothetical protein [Clostridia bacterium]